MTTTGHGRYPSPSRWAYRRGGRARASVFVPVFSLADPDAAGSAMFLDFFLGVAATSISGDVAPSLADIQINAHGHTVIAADVAQSLTAVSTTSACGVSVSGEAAADVGMIAASSLGTVADVRAADCARTVGDVSTSFGGSILSAGGLAGLIGATTTGLSGSATASSFANATLSALAIESYGAAMIEAAIAAAVGSVAQSANGSVVPVIGGTTNQAVADVQTLGAATVLVSSAVAAAMELTTDLANGSVTVGGGADGIVPNVSGEHSLGAAISAGLTSDVSDIGAAEVGRAVVGVAAAVDVGAFELSADATTTVAIGGALDHRMEPFLPTFGGAHSSFVIKSSGAVKGFAVAAVSVARNLDWTRAAAPSRTSARMVRSAGAKSAWRMVA